MPIGLRMASRLKAIPGVVGPLPGNDDRLGGDTGRRRATPSGEEGRPAVERQGMLQGAFQSALPQVAHLTLRFAEVIFHLTVRVAAVILVARLPARSVAVTRQV